MIALLLALATTAVYLRVGTFDFVPFDDREYVAENLRVQAGLTAANIRWALTTDYFANWHPLTWLSYMLDCELFGPRPGPIHLVSVAWHVINSVLLFFVLRSMTAATNKSAMVAFLFALHPLHVESVAWVAERKDVLSGFFFIVTTAAYLGYVRRPSLWRYFLTAGLMFLGLAAKPMLVTLPCVLLLLDFWPLNRWKAENDSPAKIRRRVRWLVIEKLPLFGVVAASCVITFLAQLNSKTVGGLDALPLTARLANAGIAYMKYVGKTIWPTNLAAFYPNYGFAPADDPHYSAFLAIGFAALVALAALTLVILWFGRRFRYLAVGWLWFVGTLVPVIGLVQVGSQGMADRYTYIPLIGLFLMVVWGVSDLSQRFPYRRLVIDLSTVAVVVACIGLTWVQVGYWKNGMTLFSHAWEVNPHPRVLQLFAVSLARAGRHEEAIKHYKELTATRPNEASPHHLLGASLFVLKRYDEALVHFRRSVELSGDDAVVRYNFGNLLKEMGDLEGAADQYRASIAILPLPRAHNNLGTVFMKQGKYAEAAEQFEAALEISPTYLGARQNLELLRAEHPAGRDKFAALDAS